MALRPILGVLCGALVAAFGAEILGEYEFTGSLPFFAGLLFGLAVGEVVVTVGRSRAVVVAGGAAIATFGGLVWAGWIDSNEGVEPVKSLVWVAAAIGAVTAFLRTVDLRRPQG